MKNWRSRKILNTDAKKGIVSEGQLLNQAPAGPNKLSLRRPSQITVSRCGMSMTMPGIIMVEMKRAKMTLRPTKFMRAKA